MSCSHCTDRQDTDRESTGSGLSRRSFIERVTLATIGVVLAACDSPVAPMLPTGGPYEVRMADYPGLAQVGGVARVDLSDGSVVGVGRFASTDFAAYSLACTHEGTTVRVSGDGWWCPSHGATFDTVGDVTRGPAGRDLASVPIRYDPDTGILTINDTSSTAMAEERARAPGTPTLT